MSAGITIIPGTFNAVAPLAQMRAEPIWQEARSGWIRKRPQQWNSMPYTPPANDYDDSPMLMPPFTMGYRQFLAGIYPIGPSGSRGFDMTVDWQDMPAGTKVKINAATAVDTTAGSTSAPTSVEMTPYLTGFGAYPYYNAGLDAALNGRVTYFVGADTYGGYTIPANPPDSPNPLPLEFVWTVAAIQIRVIRAADNAVLRYWEVAPKWSSTITLLGSAENSGTLEASTRNMRIKYDLGAGTPYTLLTPAGFGILSQS